jgi:hypothetical protein
MIAAPNGLLLLARFDISFRPFLGSDSTRIIWNVLDSNYRPMGTVTLPYRFEPLVFENCSVLGLIKDPDNIPSVYRFRIARNGPGGALECN